MTVRPLPLELQKKSEAELNEVSHRIQEDLKHIKLWLSKQRHLKVRLDDQWLMVFLRGCKFSLERTKEKIDSYYTMRTLIPEFFSDRNPFSDEIQNIMNRGAFWIPLPKSPDKTAPRVLFTNSANFDPDKVSILSSMKVNLMILDILLYEDDSFNITGHYAIQDLKNMSISHLTQLTPSFFKKITTCLRNGYPIRPKGVHFLNTPSFFERMHSVLKPFVSEKVKGRMVIHDKNDFTELYKVLPKDLLPEECGGTNGTLDDLRVGWKLKIESYQKWFAEEAKYYSDEKKRLGNPKTATDVFGLEGSFRKLDLD